MRALELCRPKLRLRLFLRRRRFRERDSLSAFGAIDGEVPFVWFDMTCHDEFLSLDVHLPSTVHCVDDEIIGWGYNGVSNARSTAVSLHLPLVPKAGRAFESCALAVVSGRQ